LDTDNQQSGEGYVFQMLQSAPNTDDWIVIHSLDIADHRKQVCGEIDFVVIVPSAGVLVLEVKGCRSLFRNNGLWYYGPSSLPDHRGPFKQASAAMHSLRLKLASRRPDLSHILFWSAVVFPYVPFDEESPEWHPWQVIDQIALRGHSLEGLIRRVLARAKRLVREKPEKSRFLLDDKSPTPKQCKEIAQELRPDFEFFESPRSRVKRVIEEIKFFTEEQFVALDAMQSNRQILFVGPAGTGKTLLALETVRRASVQKSKVLFLCFNRILGSWLSEQVKDLASTSCRTIHRYMIEISGSNTPDTPKDSTYWKQELPSLAIERLLEDLDEEKQFDCLVVDEAQDIVTELAYLDVLDLSLKGGLSRGVWRFFGDFERQDIFSDSDASSPIASGRFASVPTYSLTVNCRNTPRIASLASFLGDLIPTYKKILRPDNGSDPQWFFYSTVEEEMGLLVSLLDQLLRTGYSANDVIILSTRADSKCVAAQVKHPLWQKRLQPYRLGEKGALGYCTIHAFKGMEKPVVIVTDINEIPDEKTRNLIYVAASRALDVLYLLVAKKAKAELREILYKSSLNQGATKE
jgi:DNA polymerase III delta prime subunit